MQRRARKSAAKARDRGPARLSGDVPAQYLYLSLRKYGDVPGFEGREIRLYSPARGKWNQEKLLAGPRQKTRYKSFQIIVRSA